MEAIIVTVGKELLLGDIENTNERYLAEAIKKIGIAVIEQVTLDDDLNALVQYFQRLVKNNRLLMISGGLGPTEDDLTKEALAQAFNLDLEFDAKLYKECEDYFKLRGRNLTPNVKKQFYRIKGSKLLENKWGTAPGEYLLLKGCSIFLLPGPPFELQNMVDTYLEQFLKTKEKIKVKSLWVMNIGESQVEDKIRKNIKIPDLKINTFAHNAQVEIKCIAQGQEEEKLDLLLLEAEKSIKELFKDAIYSLNKEKLEEKIIRLAKEKNLRLSFAESITGGLLAKKITSCPGASNILHYSLVSYSNEIKHKELGVKGETLERYGAVSQETALEMAQGLYKKGHCDIAISTTGEAGPNPAEKEVGSVFAGFYSDHKKFVKEFKFQGNRREIQEKTTNLVLFTLLKEFLEG